MKVSPVTTPHTLNTIFPAWLEENAGTVCDRAKSPPSEDTHSHVLCAVYLGAVQKGVVTANGLTELLRAITIGNSGRRILQPVIFDDGTDSMSTVPDSVYSGSMPLLERDSDFNELNLKSSDCEIKQLINDSIRLSMWRNALLTLKNSQQLAYLTFEAYTQYGNGLTYDEYLQSENLPGRKISQIKRDTESAIRNLKSVVLDLPSIDSNLSKYLSEKQIQFLSLFRRRLSPGEIATKMGVNSINCYRRFFQKNGISLVMGVELSGIGKITSVSNSRPVYLVVLNRLGYSYDDLSRMLCMARKDVYPLLLDAHKRFGIEDLSPRVKTRKKIQVESSKCPSGLDNQKWGSLAPSQKMHFVRLKDDPDRFENKRFREICLKLGIKPPSKRISHEDEAKTISYPATISAFVDANQWNGLRPSYKLFISKALSSRIEGRFDEIMSERTGYSPFTVGAYMRHMARKFNTDRATLVQNLITSSKR